MNRLEQCPAHDGQRIDPRTERIVHISGQVLGPDHQRVRVYQRCLGMVILMRGRALRRFRLRPSARVGIQEAQYPPVLLRLLQHCDGCIKSRADDLNGRFGKYHLVQRGAADAGAQEVVYARILSETNHSEKVACPDILDIKTQRLPEQLDIPDPGKIVDDGHGSLLRVIEDGLVK